MTGNPSSRRSVLFSFRFLATAVAGSVLMALVSSFGPLPAQLAMLGAFISILSGLFLSYLGQEEQRERERAEAIRSLSAEGWLDFHAHLGVVVASIKAEQLIEVYAIRGGLQAVAIRLGGPAYTDKLLADVDRNLEASETAASAGDAALYARLNREFHGFLTNTPTTQWTLKLLTNLWAQTSALHRGFEAAPERIRNSLNEHRAIRAALGARDLERAAQLVVEHERLGGEALIAALRRNGLNEPTDQG